MMKLVTGMVALGLSGTALAGVHTFPSASSTVVGSTGFITPTEVGFFWSAARGDSVQQTFADPLGVVSGLTLDMVIPRNSLTAGNFVNWAVELNGTEVGMFTVPSGQTGPISNTFSFAPIASPGSYQVRVEARNTVPGGGGSHTFGAVERTSVTLVPAPASAALLGLGGLVAGRRRR